MLTSAAVTEVGEWRARRNGRMGRMTEHTQECIAAGLAYDEVGPRAMIPRTHPSYARFDAAFLVRLSPRNTEEVDR